MTNAADAARSRRFRLIALIVVGVLLLTVLAWMTIEPKTLQIEQVYLTASDLPSDIGQLKILFMTDLHVGYHFSSGRLSDLTSRVNALKPDVILLGGDYSTDQAGAIDFFRSFPDFHARYGIYAVLGDTDMDGEQLTALRRAMMTAGVTSLQNETAVVRIGNSSITIAGVGDPTTGNADVSGVAEMVRSTDYAVLLCHSPEAIDLALRSDSQDGQRRWFDLGLFGHTHGGQFALGGWSPVALSYDEWGGTYREGSRVLHVSTGMGGLIPFRLGQPAEIVVITLKSEE